MFTSNWIEDNANVYDELISAINKGDERTVESILSSSSMSGWEANPLYAAVSCNNNRIKQMMCDHYRKFDRYSIIVLKKIISDWNEFSTREKQIYETIIRELTCKNDLIVNNSGPIFAQACESGNVDIVKILIKLGFNLNLPDKNSKLVPLHLAIMKNRTAVVEELMKAGANVNVSDRDGNRSLHFAANSGELNIVRALLRHGASLDSKNYILKYTPLHAAVEKGQFAMVEELIRAGANVNVTDKDGKSPLHSASELGNLEIAKILIDHEADVDWKMIVTEYTPLFLAVKNNHSEVVQLLLKANADVNISAADGKTPLYLALEFDASDIVDMLIARDASVFINEDNEKTTLLHTAASFDNAVVVKKLVLMGIDINVRDFSGKTALHLAAKCGMNAIESLLSLGADKYLEDDKGRLAFHEAVGINAEAMDLLFDANVARRSREFQKFVDDILKNCECPSDCYSVRSNRAFNLVLKHLIRYQAVNMQICDNVKLKRHAMQVNYYDECFLEVERLKTLYLIDGRVSLYDYLHMKPRCRLAYVDFLPRKVEKLFENYGYLIKDFTDEALTRKSLFNSSRDVLYELTDVYLPDVCMERILDFLNLQNLKNLSKAQPIVRKY